MKQKHFFVGTALVLLALVVGLFVVQGHAPFANGRAEAANPPKGTQQTTSAAAVAGPVNKTWYFAEGRVGKLFREYLTIDNPSTTVCALSIQYLYTMDGSTAPATKTVAPTVAGTSRLTESVNADLGIADTSTSAAIVSAIVNVKNGCNGVVAERPVYFSKFMNAISSGTDAMGVTHPGTNFFFADVPTGTQGTSYLTILNPGTKPATVTANYFANGQKVGTQSVTAAATSRTTITPGLLSLLPNHFAAVVTSTQPVVVERPSYFVKVNGLTGAADVVGATALNTDWFFAEGYANGTSQEYLTIANVDPVNKPAAVTINLKSSTGATQAFKITVPASSQTLWNVNTNNIFTGSTPEVSAEVQSAGAMVVVQREMFYQYHHTLARGTLQTGAITDVIGLPAVNLKNVYSFAEGYTAPGYNEWLTIQNPTKNAETITVTLVNGNGTPLTQNLTVAANSRSTLDVTAVMQSAGAGTSTVANAVSMTVQSGNNGGAFIAERPEYFNTARISPFVVSGETDVIGYMGN